MNTEVLEQPIDIETYLARINAATWVEMGFGAHALVTADDNEALAVLTARFIGMDPEQGLWVVDGSDACYRGLENAKRCAVRDLKVDAGLQ